MNLFFCGDSLRTTNLRAVEPQQSAGRGLDRSLGLSLLLLLVAVMFLLGVSA